METSIVNAVVLLVALTVTSGLGVPGADQSDCIIVEISGVRETGGELIVGLFNQPDGFPDMGNEYRGITVPVGEDPRMTCRFEDVPFGQYAIAIFHDANLNGVLDKNFFGLPSEGVGLSGKARRPNFETAKFEFIAQYTLTIELRY